MTAYGYIRVSSLDQNEDRQLMAMREAHIDQWKRLQKTNVYEDAQETEVQGPDLYQKHRQTWAQL